MMSVAYQYSMQIEYMYMEEYVVPIDICVWRSVAYGIRIKAFKV